MAGSGKSGTTLLVALLDGHPDLLAFPEETAYFPTVRRKYRKANRAIQSHYLTESAESRLLFADTDASLGNRDYSGFPRREFRAAFEQLANDPGHAPTDLLALMMQAYCQTVGRPLESVVRWIEKTPANRWCIPDIRATYPRAKILLALRDPRAITAAFLKRQRRNGDGDFSLYLCAKNWMEAARLAISLRDDPAVHVVRFEDLVTRPEDVLRAVCQFLEISFDPVLMQPTKAGVQWRGNSTSQKSFDGISAAPANHWRKVLTTDEIAFIESFCAPAMDQLGYEPTGRDHPALIWMQKFPEESTRGYLRDRRRAVQDRISGFWRLP